MFSNNISIYSYITKIEKFTFRGCKSLCQMFIPYSVNINEADTFKECLLLKKKKKSFHCYRIVMDAFPIDYIKF